MGSIERTAPFQEQGTQYSIKSALIQIGLGQRVETTNIQTLGILLSFSEGFFIRLKPALDTYVSALIFVSSPLTAKKEEENETDN